MIERKISIVIVCLTFCPIIFGSACNRSGANNSSHNHQAQQANPSPSPSLLARRVPAYFKEPPDVKSLPPTLEPEQFPGKIRNDYCLQLSHLLDSDFSDGKPRS
jgi:hypothetical protein